MFFAEPSEEQRAAWALEKARQEVIIARFRRMLIDMPIEDLQLLTVLFTYIATSQSPTLAAKYYEGVIDGILWTRDIRLGETPSDDLALFQEDRDITDE